MISYGEWVMLGERDGQCTCEKCWEAYMEASQAEVIGGGREQ